MTRYELLDRIGVGGMAEIFRGKAIAAGGFEKPVAIKRILPHLSQDKRFVELLIAEAKVLSLLKHRNIVQIFDVGLGDDGQYFLVMEYVDGKDLGAIQRGLELGRRRIPFDLVLHVGAEICEALEHAHSARAPDGKSMSLVHRDVSPSNVLVSRAGELKLTDFGIAKRAEQEATGHGAVRGKYAYISPEQARNEHLDPRSDVFSVGILLWELVTGLRLFSGLGDLEALRAVREAKVPRPRDLDDRLGAEIDALIMSTLAPEPRGRPSAGQLGARLRTLRYSLDVTVGDPATELAKIIDATDDALRDNVPAPVAAVPSARLEFDGSEATVIRIHTADEFSMGDHDGTGMARAREVIDRFEEEETRQAQLSRDQMAFLRNTAVRDSGELTSTVEPPLPGMPPRRVSDEQTRAHPPLELAEVSSDDAPTYPPPDAPTFLPDSGPNLHFEPDEATRMVAPLSRRTPPPERLPPSERLPVPEHLAPERLPPSERLPLPERVVAPERLPPSERLPLPEHLAPERLPPSERLPLPDRVDRVAPAFVEPPSRSERRAPPERRSEPPGRAERAEPERFVEPPSRSERRPRLATQPPPASRRAPTGESHTPPPGTVQERWVQLPPSAAPMHPPPPSLPPAVPLPGIPPTPQAPPRAIPATPQAPPRAVPQPPMHAPMPPVMHAPAPAMRPSMPPPGHAPALAMRPSMPPPGHAPPAPAQIPPPRQSQIPPPPGPHAAWMTPSRPIPGPGSASQRGANRRASVTAMNRRKPLKPWVLMVGALLMAFLAFAVTRACIHTPARPVAPAHR